jgi:hypothetical protein
LTLIRFVSILAMSDSFGSGICWRYIENYDFQFTGRSLD